MEDGDTEKYHARSVKQDVVFSSQKGGLYQVISLQVYNKIKYHTLFTLRSTNTRMGFTTPNALVLR